MPTKDQKWPLLQHLWNIVKSVTKMTEDEMIDIRSRIVNGEDLVYCRNKLIMANLWIVTAVAEKLNLEEFYSRDDVLCNGLSRLCEAINSYINKGDCEFSVAYIYNEVKTHMIRSKKHEDRNVCKNTKVEFISANQIIGQADVDLIQMIPDPDHIDLDELIDRKRLRERFKKAYDKLFKDSKDARTKTILSHQFELFDTPSMSLRDLGKAFGVSHNAIFLSAKKACNCIKESKEMQELYRDFIEV
jgi:DNA-directed RNA polymerase sigma subunit (sigma70/sigma32)